MGSIAGVITDEGSKETLIGCTVWVDGTNNVVTTDLDGKFVLKNIKTGTHKVNVSYISYQKKSFTVKVAEGQELRLDVDMTPETVQMEQAVVVGRRKTETDATVLQNIKSSDVVMNGISSQLITKTQDKDAAEVLKKIPGITITDGRFVIVRGLTERYNTVWLNGASAPSFESDSRAFSFDVIPSNMISNIQIIKTPAPENPADFAGAVIKVTTKNDALANSLKISYSGSYIQNVTGKKFLIDKAGSKEWLGYDDGTKSLPSNFPTTEEMVDYANKATDESADEKISETEKLTDVTKQMSGGKSWTPVESKAIVPQSLSIFSTRSFKLKSVTIGNITAVNYGYSENRVESERQFYNVEQGLFDYRYNDTTYKRSVKAGVIHNWMVNFKKGHKLEFRNFLNQMGESKFVSRGGTEFTNNNTISHYEDYKYECRTIYNAQLAGFHEFREGASKFDWLLGYSYTFKNTPDERRFLWEKESDTTDFTFILKPSPDPYVGSCYFQQLKENMGNVVVNFEHKFDLLGNGKPWVFKTGIFYEKKQRDFWLRNLGFTINSINREIDMTAPIDSILNDRNYFDVDVDTTIVTKYRYYTDGRPPRPLGTDTLLDYKYGILLKENTFPQDAYKAITGLEAAYLGLKIPLGKFTIYGGVRAEHYSKLIYDFYNQELTQEAKDTMNIETTELDLFPSVNLSYSLTKTMMLRISYGKTINRPELREVASFSYNNFEDKTFVIGNPSLKSALIHNFDARWEWYPSETELVSFSAFYKYFINPIEISFASNKGSGITLVPENTASAVSQGLEVDVRKSLQRLEKSDYFWFLKNFTLVMNASVIKSEITTSQETAREKTRPMQGQSPYIINIGTYYQSQKGTMVSLMYNRIGKRIIFTGNDKTPHYWELPYNSLDLTFAQKINKYIEVKFGVKDIIAGKQRVVLYDGLVDKGTEYDVFTTQKNRTFSAGVTCSF